jgi:hypothetical protein
MKGNIFGIDINLTTNFERRSWKKNFYIKFQGNAIIIHMTPIHIQP